MERAAALGVLPDTPGARFLSLCAATNTPVVGPGSRSTICYRGCTHSMPHGSQQNKPVGDTRTDRLIVSVGDRAVPHCHGQSGLIAFACAGRLKHLGQSGRKGSRA
jgi:hypothetical protein